MAKDSDHLAGSFDTENTGGFLTGFLAEEDNFDRRTLWRLGSWAAASVGAVIVAVMSNHSSIGLHRDQVAGTDLARQSQQIQSVAKESQNEARRLASAIETLNGDRDRLYSRVTVLEQGLESVTGAPVFVPVFVPVFHAAKSGCCPGGVAGGCGCASDPSRKAGCGHGHCAEFRPGRCSLRCTGNAEFAGDTDRNAADGLEADPGSARDGGERRHRVADAGGGCAGRIRR
jgi:hypothetical protein